MHVNRWIAGLVLFGACERSNDTGPLPGCSDPPRGPLLTRFLDVTADSGIRFLYASPDFRGGGLAVADLDGDGLPEIVAGRRTGGLALFHNRGALRFDEVAGSGLDATLAVTAIAATDLDNDGDRDLVIAGAGVAYVMENQGDGSFREAARFDSSGTTEHILSVDLDGDGLLDLYFSNRDLTSSELTRNRLYMNRGGLQFAFAGTVGDGLSWTTTAFDLDGDGDQDLYVANDTLLPDFGRPGASSSLPTDLLLRNDGPGADGIPRLTDISADMGLSTPRSSMGGVLGDFDEDGRPDLYVPNLGAKKLFLRGADGYLERAAELGVAAISRVNDMCGPDTAYEDCLLLSWSAVLTDFDLDGYDELLVMNGMTAPDSVPPALLFVRGPDLPYHEVAPDLACMDARAVVAADLDGDGDQDLAIAQQDGPLVVYANRGTPVSGSWLRVQLRGQASNRDGVGAVVIGHLASGRTQVRVVGAGGIIHASSPDEAFFGLGEDIVQTLEVRWPSGRYTEVDRPPPGALLVVEPD